MTLRTVWVLTLACSLAHADSDVARAALEAGKQSLARREWAAAAAQFQRAVAEDGSLHEARWGMAEAFFGSADRAHAVEALRGLLATLEGAVPLSAENAALYGRARKRLCEASAEDAALDAIVRRHSDDLAALGGRWARKDPTVAERAARTALGLAPDHSKAASLLKRSREGVSAKRTVVFSGKDLVGWTWMSPPTWKLHDGLLVGDAHGIAMIARTNAKWGGDFDVLVEARLVEPYEKEGPPHFALFAPFVDRERHFALGYMQTSLYWFRRWGLDDTKKEELLDRPYAEVGTGLDPKAWTTYEMRVRAKEIIAVVNGEEVGRTPRPKEYAEGHVGLVIQCCKVQFRRVEVLQR